MFTFIASADGFRIYRDGALFIEQPFKPSEPGFVPFASAEEATGIAQAMTDELIAAATAPAPTTPIPEHIRIKYNLRG